MAELKFEQLYRVTVTENEIGWASRPCPEETKFFDNEEEALAYAKGATTYSTGTYWTADVTKIV